MLDLDKVLSDKVKKVKPSGIRKYFDILNTMEGAISLGVGEPDFDTPWEARRAGIKSLEKGYTFYTSNWGLLELRQEISSYLDKRYDLKYNFEDEILVTVGGSEAIDNALRAFISDGDEVIIPQPSFVCYTPLTLLAGGVPVVIKTEACDEFKLTAEKLINAITDKTKVLIMPFPNNPTGAIMTKDELEEIAKVIRDTNIIVISDEIYSELTYKQKHVSIASIEGMRERTIVINGFSKSFAMTGWRLGYACGPKELMSYICKIHQFGIMSAPTVSQFAATEALRSCIENTEQMHDDYDLRRRYLLSELRNLGFDCFEPYGAFYVFPSIQFTGLTSEQFCEKLLFEQKLAVIPGNAFGDSGEGFVRISYSYSMTHLKEAMKRLKIFMDNLNK